MKFVRLALWALPFAFLACGDSSSTASPEGGSSYGEQQYLRQGENSRSTGDCRVYATGSSVTLVFKQDFGKLGNISSVSQVEVGSTVYVRDEITASGWVFSDAIEDQCSQIKEKYDEIGGTVNCTDTEVKAQGKTGSVIPAQAGAAFEKSIGMMKDYCDMYIESLEESGDVSGNDSQAEVPDTLVSRDGSQTLRSDTLIENPFEGKSPGQAISCSASQKENSVVFEIIYMDKTATLVTVMKDGWSEVTEYYTGVDAETLSQVCNAYRAEDGLYDIVCGDGIIAYRADEVYPLEEMVLVIEDYMCPALLDGSMTLEDLWYGD